MVDNEETDVNMRNWNVLIKDRDYWGALVNAALNLGVQLVL